MARRKSKNKLRCEYCNRIVDLNNRCGCIHTACVEPYVKKVMNKSIIVTIFDKPRKPIAFVLMFLIFISLAMAGSYIYSFKENVNASAFYFAREYDTGVHEPDTIQNVSVQRTNSWMYFDGVNDYLNISDSINMNFETDITFSFWMRFVPDMSHAHMIIKNYDANEPYPGFGIMINQGIIQYWSGTHGSWVQATGSKIKNYTWQHVLIAVNETDVSYYFDGVLDMYNSSTIPNEPVLSTILGCIGDGGACFNGDLDEFRIYNRFLESSEINEIYNAGRVQNHSLPNDGLILWYAFDEYEGNIVYDLSGGNHYGV